MSLSTKIRHWMDYHLPDKNVAFSILTFSCGFIAIMWFIHYSHRDIGQDWHPTEATIRRCSLDPSTHTGRLENHQKVWANLVVSYAYERYPYSSLVTIPDVTGVKSLDRFKVDASIVVRVNPESPQHATLFWEDQAWVRPKCSTAPPHSPR